MSRFHVGFEIELPLVITEEWRIFTIYFFIISDKPKVGISFGRNINSRQIKEGDDVYFECRILAYPQANKVIWTKNVGYIIFSTHLG